ncbi:piggyBac transposable element-derived protein 4-like [Anomaloglossus baeobatrachus]
MAEKAFSAEQAYSLLVSSSSESDTDSGSDFQPFTDSDDSDSSTGSHSSMVEESVDAAETSDAGPSSARPHRLWHPDPSFSPQIPPFLATPGINVEVADFTPFDFFQIFITTEVLQLIVFQTNLYAHQYISQNPTSAYSHSWTPTNVPELRKFLGITLNMGLVKKPSLRSYWATKTVHSTPVFAAVMTRTRYETLLRFLHFSDNSQAPPRNDPNYDHLHKLRPLISLLKDSFLNSYTPDQNVSVDESLSFKGRLSLRQFIPSRRARYEIKLYKMCESTSGYTCTFLIYQGRNHQINPPNCPKTIGMPGKIVWELMTPFLEKGYHVYTDNSNTSIPLYKSLHAANTGACGTIRKKRGIPSQLVSRSLEKGASCSLASDNLLAVKWNDCKDVYMLTSLHKDTTVKVRDRGATKDRQKPLCIKDYNKFMGGVDLSDQVLQPYLVKRKTRAWYKKVAIYLLHTATYNSFVLYKKSQGPLAFLQYQEKIIERLLFDSKVQEAAFESEDVRRLSERHFIHLIPFTPTQRNPKKRCRVCRKHGKRSESRYFCPTCPSQPGLCICPCFEIYHTSYNY